METTERKIDELIPYSRNPRKNKEAVDYVASSIKEYGFRQPIVVDEEDVVVVGHTRLKAAQKLGLKTVPVHVAKGLTSQQIKAYRIADNKTAEYSEFDYELLNLELEELEKSGYDILNTGFSGQEVNDIFDDFASAEDSVLESMDGIDTVTKTGDIWLLGDHRLLCGDSTDPENYHLLLKDEKIRLCFTSPPYNINDGAGRNGKGTYNKYEDNLPSEEYIDFNMKVVNNVSQFLKGFIFWNISYNKNARSDFIDIMYNIKNHSNLEFLELICWNKRTALPNTSDIVCQRTWEQIIVATDKETSIQDIDYCIILRNTPGVVFNKKTKMALPNYWEARSIGSQTKKDSDVSHFACFPIKIVENAVKLMTHKNNIVLDPFGGTGTSLMACEQLRRKARIIEMDEAYVDYTIRRFKEINDTPVTLEETGETFEEVSIKRQGN